MEMKDIDLTKCVNCRFRAKDEDGDISGRIRVSERGTVYLFVDGQGNKGFLADRMQKMGITDFEIVPRDPETYKDWQVGDIIWDSHESGDNGRIIFRSGDFVAADIDGCRCYTCEELFDDGYRLVLTDIEQKIIEGKTKYEPQDGDVCFVRTDAGNCFIFIKRVGEDEDGMYTYVGIDANSRYLFSNQVSCVCDRKSIRELRPATDEEKHRLFDAMAKEGKRWNAEKKVVEDIPKSYEFRYGEPVLVRNGVCENWGIASYCRSEGTMDKVYVGSLTAFFLEIIPYNERTMHLLGTTEDYKEGE